MDKKVEIRLELDRACKSPEVIIRAEEHDSLVEHIIRAIEECAAKEQQVAVSDGSRVVMLNQWEILRVYTENRRVYVCTDTKQYETRSTLQDLEAALEEKSFVRISRFEIVNFRKIRSFDLSISGTIRLYFENGTETWVARRYVRSIQEKLRASLRGGERNE
ncbi:MAG: LytTR family transcriptional regulator DNA-binding domain-containing protein [Lachnospiraceae bacterium]|nr:LytTR family transcriptional regulator DNA-binding domain-containing protein [Lachnospiraceae bacterium]